MCRAVLRLFARRRYSMMELLRSQCRGCGLVIFSVLSGHARCMLLTTMRLHPSENIVHNRVVAPGWPRLGLLALLVATMMIGAASAQTAEELVHLINDYRSEGRSCDGRTLQAAGPLAPHAGLSNVQISGTKDLRKALRKQNYSPASFQAISISGPASPSAAMDLIMQRYCQPLMNPQYAEIGVSREGRTWRIVLARPVLSPDLSSWSDAGREILKLINQARSEPRTCGRQEFGAALPLAWAPRLGAASLTHSRDMARQNYFSHRAKNGKRVNDRVERQGYTWRNVGENIAAGQGSAKQAVSAWVSSPPHCVNLMNPNFTEMGAAYAVDKKSDYTIYWTQVFAAPR